MTEKAKFFTMVITTVVIIVVAGGLFLGMKYFSSDQGAQKEEGGDQLVKENTESVSLMELNIQFPQNYYKVGNRVFGDNTGEYELKPKKEDIKGVFLLRFSRPGLGKKIYARRQNYTYPVTGKRRSHIKQEVRQSVSEEEFQKRLNGHLSGVLRAFLINDSKTKAYTGSFQEAGKYTYTLSFYSCQDISAQIQSSCFQADPKKIDNKVKPTDEISKTVTVKEK